MYQIMPINSWLNSVAVCAIYKLFMVAVIGLRFSHDSSSVQSSEDILQFYFSHTCCSSIQLIRFWSTVAHSASTWPALQASVLNFSMVRMPSRFIFKLITFV